MAALTGKIKFLEAPNRALFYFLILTVFFLSGGASLIYQVSWQRALTLYYGVGPISVAIVVSIFMAGLGLGGLLGGWLSEKVKNRLFLYWMIEVGMGIFGLISLNLFKAVLPWLAHHSYSEGFLLISAVLLLPTLLMGMTLPLVVKILNAVGQHVGHTLSLLYFVNTLGAAVGAIVASYGLISFLGIRGAISTAAIINFVLSILVVLAVRIHQKMVHTPNSTSTVPSIFSAFLTRLAPSAPAPLSSTSGSASVGFRSSTVCHLFIFVSGFLAIAYQIVWVRVLGILLKHSTYVFSTVLAIYLLGLAIGSYLMSIWIRRISPEQYKNLFFKLNFGIAVITVLTVGLFYQFAESSVLNWFIKTTFSEQLHPPYHPMYAIRGETVKEWLTSAYLAWDIVIWPLLIVFPSTLLMGASFPLIAALTIGNDRREGFKSGSVYAVMVLGNVLGALVTGLVLLPKVGSEIVLLAAALVGTLWCLGVTQVGRFEMGLPKRVTATVLVGVIACLIMPKRTELYGVIHPIFEGYQRVVNEDVDGVVVAYQNHNPYGHRTEVYINGSAHASYPHAAYHLQAYEAVSHAKVRKEALVIGFGSGDFTDFLLHTPGVEHVTVVEISKTLIKNLTQHPFYVKFLQDPRIELHIEDGRRFLLNSDKKYDLVGMDPLHTTTAYSNNIYSYEFFDLVKKHMSDTGVLVTWFNEYEVIPRTLATVFPQMHCYSVFCLSSKSPMKTDVALQKKLWKTFDWGMQKGMLASINQDYYYKGSREAMLEKIHIQEINTDWNPITEYYFGYNLKRYYGKL